MTIWGYRSVWLAGTALLALVVSGPGRAQDRQEENQTLLQTIVVKGKKIKPASVASDTPLASQTTADVIAKKEIRNVGDLGNTTEPGVDYVESRQGAPGGMFIRGLGGPRVANIIDDIPIPYLETLTRTGSASPTTGISDSSNSFDFGSLAAVDVLRGADSSRVGSGALAGALLMRTLEPDDLIENGRNWGALVRTGYDSRDKGFHGSVAGAFRSGATSVLLQGALRKASELENKGKDDIIGTRRTKPNPSDVDQNNLLFKLRHDLEGGHHIGLTAERFDLTSDVDLRTLQNGTTYRPDNYWGFDDTRRERISLDYDYEAAQTGGLIDNARLVAYWQRLTKNAGSNATRFQSGAPNAPSWAYDRENQARESAFGLTGAAVSSFETAALSHTVRYGGNLNISRYDQFLTSIGGTAPGTLPASQADVPNANGTKLGLYIDDRIAFANSAFTITPGLRLDWHRYKPKLTGSYEDNSGFDYFGLAGANDGFRLSPKVLVEYQASQQLNLFAQWSMAYRAPTVTELYSNFTNVRGGYAVIGNPDLKAETGNGFELGAAYDSGDFSGRVTVFHNSYRNFIEATEDFTDKFPPGYFPEFLLNSWRNLDRVEISGIELKARKDFDNGIYLSGSLAYAYGKDKTNNKVLRSVAPFKSILGVGYAGEHWGTELTGIFAGRMRNDGDDKTYDAPAYAIANLEAWWEPEQVKGMRIQAGVYNLFDKTYYNALKVRNVDGTGDNPSFQPLPFYSEPGRNFRISLTQKF